MVINKKMFLNERHYVTVFLTIAAIVFIGSFSACDGGDDPSEEEIFLQRLGHEWKLTTGRVTVDGVDVTGAFADMAITFTTNTYSVTNAVPPIWPASGSFTLSNRHNDLFDITRDDGTVISVVALSEEGITLRLQYTPSNGRTKSVGGQYEFILNR